VTESVASFVSNFSTRVSSLPVNQLVQAIEMLAGPEIPLLGDNNASMNLIAAGGFITPLNPKATLETFSVPTNDPVFLARFPQAVGKTFIAFTQPDRNRFFRQYYGGLRFKRKYLGFNQPGTFDMAYGVNESVTRGRIRGGVLRIDGYLPVPVGSAGTYVGIFGSALLKPAPSNVTQPLLLNPASGVTVPAPNVAVVTLPTIDRDYYRVGVAVDLIATFCKIPGLCSNYTQQ
jgi:hypothetical protein